MGRGERPTLPSTVVPVLLFASPPPLLSARPRVLTIHPQRLVKGLAGEGSRPTLIQRQQAQHNPERVPREDVDGREGPRRRRRRPDVASRWGTPREASRASMCSPPPAFRPRGGRNGCWIFWSSLTGPPRRPGAGRSVEWGRPTAAGHVGLHRRGRAGRRRGEGGGGLVPAACPASGWHGMCGVALDGTLTGVGCGGCVPQQEQSGV